MRTSRNILLRGNLPTHSYQRYLYKYPQAEFPYNELVAVNRARSTHEMEYELIDTGVFDDDRYFDVEVEHAKAGPEDILCRVTVHNRSAQDAALHVLPTLWFRNIWSWENGEPNPGSLASRRHIRSSGPSTIRLASSTSTPSLKRPCCSVRTKRIWRGYSAPSPGRPSPRMA